MPSFRTAPNATSITVVFAAVSLSGRPASASAVAPGRGFDACCQAAGSTCFSGLDDGTVLSQANSRPC